MALEATGHSAGFFPSLWVGGAVARASAWALSEEQVRRLLGYETRLEVHGFLKEHSVYLRYTVEDLERARAAHKRLDL
jgi:Uncharacterised protein family (UPF0175)